MCSQSLTIAALIVVAACSDPPELPPGFTRFDGTDDALPSGELAPLWALCGEARLVGLGESIHTSGGFYAAKHRLIRTMIEARGVRVIAFGTPRDRAPRGLRVHRREGQRYRWLPKRLARCSEPPRPDGSVLGRVGDNMTEMTEKLEDALASAFPPVTIDRAMLDEPTAIWDVYEDRGDLVALEGKTWRELAPELLYRHSALPLWAGDALWRAILPGYLRYLLRERTRFNDLPFQLAGELTRSDDPGARVKFDRRIAAFSAEQRAVIRDVVAVLAKVRPMEEPMSRALATWNDVEGVRT